MVDRHRLNCHGRPLTPTTLARMEERARLVNWDVAVRQMAVQVVTDEWPRGFCRRIPTTKGAVILLMQPGTPEEWARAKRFREG